MSTKTIELSQGYFITVDAVVYSLISKYKWCVQKHKDAKKRTVYAQAWMGGKKVTLHRLIMSAFKGEVIDHINGNGLDNRYCNLRIVTLRQNSLNRAKHGTNMTSKFKGVSRRKDSKKWHAAICVNETHLSLGFYDTEVGAAIAYNKAAMFHFGEFARLNIV